jgi:hypothetical protein
MEARVGRSAQQPPPGESTYNRGVGIGSGRSGSIGKEAANEALGGLFDGGSGTCPFARRGYGGDCAGQYRRSAVEVDGQLRTAGTSGLSRLLTRFERETGGQAQRLPESRQPPATRTGVAAVTLIDGGLID